MARIKKLQRHARLSLGILIVGALLMACMLVEDKEPGVLSVLLVIGGIASYCIAKYRIRKQLNSRPRYNPGSIGE